MLNHGRVTSAHQLLKLSLVVAFAATQVLSCTPMSGGGGGYVGNDAAVDPIDTNSGNGQATVAVASAALGSADVAAAATTFDAVLAASPADAQAAFGVALTHALLLVQHPAVSDALSYAGRQAMTTAAFVGSAGVLGQLRNGVSCGAAKEAFHAALPWHAWPDFNSRKGLTAFFDAFPAGCQGNLIASKLLAVEPELKKIASSAAIAAGTSGFHMTIGGGLVGVDGDLDFGVPEARLLEGSAHLLIGAIRLLNAYDWGYTLQSDFGSAASPEARANAANQRFLVLKPGVTTLSPVRDELDLAATAWSAAIDAAAPLESADHTPPIAWADASPKHLQWLKSIIGGFQTSLHGSSAIPFLLPNTTFSLAAYFDQPFTAANASAQPFDYDPLTGSVSGVEKFFDSAVQGRFQPDIYKNYAKKDWQNDWYQADYFSKPVTAMRLAFNAAHPQCKW